MYQMVKILFKDNNAYPLQMMISSLCVLIMIVFVVRSLRKRLGVENYFSERITLSHKSTTDICVCLYDHSCFYLASAIERN